jgi:hypothetical protein
VGTVLCPAALWRYCQSKESESQIEKLNSLSPIYLGRNILSPRINTPFCSPALRNMQNRPLPLSRCSLNFSGASSLNSAPQPLNCGVQLPKIIGDQFSRYLFACSTKRAYRPFALVIRNVHIVISCFGSLVTPRSRNCVTIGLRTKSFGMLKLPRFIETEVQDFVAD